MDREIERTVRLIRWQAAFSWLTNEGSTYDSESDKQIVMESSRGLLMIVRMVNSLLPDPIDPNEDGLRRILAVDSAVVDAILRDDLPKMEQVSSDYDGNDIEGSIE
jgi:hypothetical protein